MAARETIARRIGFKLLAIGAVTFALTLVAAPAGANNGKAVGRDNNEHNDSHANNGHDNEGQHIASAQSANATGPYDGNSDGSPSRNGNGGGNATGKPCAGCVGKADDKNPPGQLPGGSDSNNGYECDGNSGIAKTNPAHTSCVTSTTAGVTTTTAAVTTTTAAVTTTTAAVTTTTAAATTTTAGATTTTALVLGVTVTRPTPTTANAEVLGVQLARTGSNVLTLLRWAGVILMIGGLCVFFGKRDLATASIRRWRS